MKIIRTAKWVDKLPGGLADGKTPSDYCKQQLEKGTRVEMEHTDDPEIAKEIAMDHLEESEDYARQDKPGRGLGIGRSLGLGRNRGRGGKYYDKLERMEDKIEEEIEASGSYFNLHKTAKKKDEETPYNPWAVCHTTVDKEENPDKYERCVQDVKEKNRKDMRGNKKKKKQKQKSKADAVLTSISKNKLKEAADKWMQKAVDEEDEGKFTEWCKRHGWETGVTQGCINEAAKEGGDAARMANFAVNANPGKYDYPDTNKQAQNDKDICQLCNKQVETFYDPKTGKRVCQKCYMKQVPNMQDLMNKNTY